MERDTKHPTPEIDTKDHTGNCSRNRKRGRSNRLVKKNSRRRDRVRGRKKTVLGNRGGRASKKHFLEAEDHSDMRGNELVKILSMGTKTMNIPLKNRHDQ